MVSVSEIFPKVNPLPSVVSRFKELWELRDFTRETALQAIQHSFFEAGVVVENHSDSVTLVKELVSAQVLEFIQFKDGPALVLHSKFREE